MCRPGRTAAVVSVRESGLRMPHKTLSSEVWILSRGFSKGSGRISSEFIWRTVEQGGDGSHGCRGLYVIQARKGGWTKLMALGWRGGASRRSLGWSFLLPPLGTCLSLLSPRELRLCPSWSNLGPEDITPSHKTLSPAPDLFRTGHFTHSLAWLPVGFSFLSGFHGGGAETG